MRCCKHYTPSQTGFDMHKGLATSEEYGFDRPFPSQTCSHPEMVGNQVIASCSYEQDQTYCPLFEPEDYTVLRQAIVNHPSFAERLRLVRTRVQYGFHEYRVISQSMPPEEEDVDEDEIEADILHRVNAHEHGEEARNIADELLDHEIQERTPLEHFDPGLPPEIPPPSYLKAAAS